MPAEFNPTFSRLRSSLAEVLADIGATAQANIVDSLSTPGSVVPFVASSPGQPSFNWDDELTTGISHEVTPGETTVTLTLTSAGVSKYAHPGKVIAADAEFGSWWNGWAFDSRAGKWVKAAEPHQVEPRPHMQPEMDYWETKLIPELESRVRV